MSLEDNTKVPLMDEALRITGPLSQELQGEVEKFVEENKNRNLDVEECRAFFCHIISKSIGVPNQELQSEIGRFFEENKDRDLPSEEFRKFFKYVTKKFFSNRVPICGVEQMCGGMKITPPPFESFFKFLETYPELIPGFHSAYTLCVSDVDDMIPYTSHPKFLGEIEDVKLTKAMSLFEDLEWTGLFRCSEGEEEKINLLKYHDYIQAKLLAMKIGLPN